MDCQPGISGWQLPYYARRLLICSTCRLLHPQCRGSGRKPGSVRYLKYRHQSNSQTIAHLNYTNHVQIDGESRSSHIPLSGVSQPAHTLIFSDQSAFCPTGSTSTAIISLLHTVTDLLQSNPFVFVISLDIFSPAPRRIL